MKNEQKMKILSHIYLFLFAFLVEFIQFTLEKV